MSCAALGAGMLGRVCKSAYAGELAMGELPVERLPNNELTLCVDHDIWDAEKLRMTADNNAWDTTASDQELAYAELDQDDFQDYLQKIESAATAPDGRAENAILDSNDIAAAFPAMMAGPGDDAAERTVTRAEGAIDSNKKWARGQVLTVGFLNVVSERIKKRIAQNINESWEDACSIRFKFVPSSSADIRITVFNGGGSWSYVGTDAKTIPSGKQTMHFGWLADDLSEEKFRSVVLHEFGHALGFIHEHQHPEADVIQWNRAAVISYYSGPPNNWSVKKIEQNVLNRYTGKQIKDEDRTAFDKTSIMLYPTSANHTNGFSSGWNTKLSSSDRKLAADVYGGGDAPPPPLPGLTTAVRKAALTEGLTVVEQIKVPGDAILFSFKPSVSGNYRIETLEGDPSITMKLRLFRSEGMTDQIGDVAHHNGARLLNARMDTQLESGKTYFILAEHFFKTQSSIGSFSIRAAQR
jgi:hypothetical protein